MPFKFLLGLSKYLVPSSREIRAEVLLKPKNQSTDFFYVVYTDPRTFTIHTPAARLSHGVRNYELWWYEKVVYTRSYSLKKQNNIFEF